MARAFFAGHNYQINLTEGQDGTEHYRQMFAFLRQSRIYHVLSHSPVICEPYLMEFWNNARYVKRGEAEIITSRVANQDIEVTAEDLRVTLQLGTIEQEGGAGGLTVFDRSIISGGLGRMGFSGDMTKSTLFKKGFFGRWRYLAHVLLVGLSNKKTGWDTLNQETQAQMVGIVYNKPYSFSKFFFNEFRKQISARGTTRFLMYPRFVMMIINDRLPNLPVVQPIRRVTTLVKRSYNEFITRNENDPNAQDVDLFGAVVDINFQTPSDEAIAGFEELPAAQPQPPPQPQHELPAAQPQPPPQQQPQHHLHHQPDVVAQQLNIMLDEQSTNPILAQAVIHETLQEHAPIDDPIADTEAYHETGVPEREACEAIDTDSESEADLADKGKGAVDESEKEMDVDDSSDDDDDDDDSDNEGRQETRIFRVGSKVIARGGSSSGIRRRREDDAEYRPEVEEPSATPQPKRARATSAETTTARPTSTSTSTPTLIATPFQFQLNDLNNKLRVMEGHVRSLTTEMENMKRKHEKEISDLKAKHKRDMDLMKTWVDQLREIMVREKEKTADAIGNVVSEMANERLSHVSKSELEEILEAFLMKKGLIPDQSCKGDELLKRRDDDSNDDPDAAEGSNRDRSYTGDMSKAIVLYQGETSQIAGSSKDVQEAADSEAEPGLFEDKIDALDDLEEFLEEEELEEGEFLPSPGQVVDWKSDDEVLPDPLADVSEHVMSATAKTDVDLVGLNENDLDELRRAATEVDMGSQSQPDTTESSTQKLRDTWFEKIVEKEKIVYREEIKASGIKEPKKGIISWFYDSELKLFVIKRFDGIQYLRNNLKTFSSLPLYEIRELAWKELKNIGDDPYAAVMERIVRREGRLNDYKLLKPRKGRMVQDKTRIDPRTNKPWLKVYYKPVKCLDKVPLKKMPQNILNNLKWWYVDNRTAEAVMESETEELLRVYDSLQLVNLSKSDLQKLHQQKIYSTEAWEDEAKKYQNVVDFCVAKDIHAGSELSKT